MEGGERGGRARAGQGALASGEIELGIGVFPPSAQLHLP